MSFRCYMDYADFVLSIKLYHQKTNMRDIRFCFTLQYYKRFIQADSILHFVIKNVLLL